MSPRMCSPHPSCHSQATRVYSHMRADSHAYPFRHTHVCTLVSAWEQHTDVSELAESVHPIPTREGRARRGR